MSLIVQGGQVPMRTLRVACSSPTTPAKEDIVRVGESVGIALTDERTDGTTTVLIDRALVEVPVKGTAPKTAVSAAKSGGNTGNGTLTVDATTPVNASTGKVGVYKVRNISVVTNNGVFSVTDPNGKVIGFVAMASGAGSFDAEIKFAMADGSTDFALGDGFDITVTAGDVAVALYDELYYNDADAFLSRNPAGKLAGKAMETVTAGATATVRVLLYGFGGNRNV